MNSQARKNEFDTLLKKDLNRLLKLEASRTWTFEKITTVSTQVKANEIYIKVRWPMKAKLGTLIQAPISKISSKTHKDQLRGT